MKQVCLIAIFIQQGHIAKHFGFPASTTLIQHRVRCTPAQQQPGLSKTRIFHAFMADTLRVCLGGLLSMGSFFH
jgi:hypothetical protein